MSAYVIGLTGGIACGKSNLSAALTAAGAYVIDADEISRGLTAPGGAALPAIRERWGDKVFDGETLDRRALADIVFSDPMERDALNGIIHPLVFSEMRRQMGEAPGIAVLDVPLLYETGMETWCDEIWCAYVPQREQVKRIRERDHVTARQAMARIRAQMPAREKARRADRVIRTDGSRENSARIVLSLWRDACRRIDAAKGETH